MKSRHKAREIALQILYQYDLNQASGQVIPLSPVDQQKRVMGDLQRHYEHFSVPDGLREFIGQLVVGTLFEKLNLDQVLEKYATNWKVARMSPVDRSLLRMAVYEMIHIKEVPHSIVINEAIELAKQFGTSETPAFINGILDSVKTHYESTSA